jgi:hypothetical protein
MEIIPDKIQINTKSDILRELKLMERKCRHIARLVGLQYGRYVNQVESSVWDIVNDISDSLGLLESKFYIPNWDNSLILEEEPDGDNS